MDLSKIPQDEIRVLLNELRIYIGIDLVDSQIAEKMGLTVGNVAKLRKQLVEIDGRDIQGKSPIEIFLEYLLQQKQIIVELGKIEADAKKSHPPQGQVRIGARKAQSEIYDKIIDRGQDLGVFSKKARELRVLGDIDIAGMDLGEIKEKVQGEMKEVNALLADEPAKYEVEQGTGTVIPLRPHGIGGGVRRKKVL